jgi:thiamine biosynthesis lipoprotein
VKSSNARTAVVMDTQVSIRTVGHDDPAAVERAFEWFRRIEQVCSRFDANSEVRQLATRVNEPVQVSDILFGTVRFALALADETDGAFDPTVGQRMERRGFDRNYRTGERVRGIALDDEPPSYRDVHVDDNEKTLMLDRPLVLDLGAVAKGFAIDMAAQELRTLEHFAIDAGGDLYLAGHNEHDAPWRVGIRHPRESATTIAELDVSGTAVCTSGDYLRRNAEGEHHIIDPRAGEATRDIISATVVAPLAIVADGLATAAFVLGPQRGIALLERHGVEGLLITSTLEHFRTRGS